MYTGMNVEKLAIGYPWVSPFMWTFFSENAMNLQRPPNSRWFRGRGWCPARRHIDLCEQAVEWGASHILIVGADQVHPEDMIPRLIKRVEVDGCEVISALVPTRGNIPQMNMKPFQPMAWRFKANDKFRTYHSHDQDSDMIAIIEPDDGELQQIDFIGSGVLMFPVDDLLMLKKPWFGEKFYLESMKREAVMDTKFVYELKWVAGAQIWVDTTIEVGHINPFIIDRTFTDRFADWDEFGYGEQKMGCCPATYYNALYTKGIDLRIHEPVRKRAGEWAVGKTLDIGCGPGAMQKYISDYHGFDFSSVAVGMANHPNVWVGDVYDIENYTGEYDTYILLEVLEHLEDDLKVLSRIPAGKRVIFSVPSFPEVSHVRTFTETTMRDRYSELVTIEQIVRFDFEEKDGKTQQYILLVKAIKKD